MGSIKVDEKAFFGNGECYKEEKSMSTSLRWRSIENDPKNQLGWEVAMIVDP